MQHRRKKLLNPYQSLHMKSISEGLKKAHNLTDPAMFHHHSSTLDLHRFQKVLLVEPASVLEEHWSLYFLLPASHWCFASISADAASNPPLYFHPMATYWHVHLPKAPQASAVERALAIDDHGCSMHQQGGWKDWKRHWHEKWVEMMMYSYVVDAVPRKDSSDH